MILSTIFGITRHHIKQRQYLYYYTLWISFVVVMSISFADDPSILTKILFIITNIILSAIIIESAFGGPALSKSEIDFALSTPADPRYVFAAKFSADMLNYMLFLAIPTAPLLLQRLSSLDLYVASLVASAVVISTLDLIFSLLRFEKGYWALALSFAAYLMVTASLSPNFNILYWLVYPDPLRVTALAALAGMLTTIFPTEALRIYYTNELYTNAYGLLERLQPRPRPAKAPKPSLLRRLMERLRLRLPQTVASKLRLLRLSWRIATQGPIYLRTAPSWRIATQGPIYLRTAPQLGRSLLYATSILAIGAAVYSLIAIRYPQWLADATVVSALFLLALLLASFSAGLRLERLWIGISTDHYAYMKWRTAARSLASLLATSPWIAAYMAVWLLLDHLPAAHAAALLVSASLTFPILTWLIAALWGEPQIRRHGLPQRPARYQLLLAFLLTGIVILYLFLALFWLYMLIFSAAFFYIALFTRLGRRIWDWLVYRLAEVGYV